MPVRLFRVAAPASTAFNLAKTFAQIVVMWGTALYVVPSLINAAELHAGTNALRFTPRVQLGLVLFLLFSAGGLWSGYIIATRGRGTPLPLDAPRAFVVSGPYRYIRNPMAVTGLGQGASVGLAMGSYGVLLYVFAGGLVWNFVFRPLEEADLEARFGEAYRAYRRYVPCWYPRLRAYSGEWAQ